MGWFLAHVVPEVIHLLEIIGVLVITVGSLRTFGHHVISYFRKEKYRVKLELGNALALGLEFKMGAEILKTILIQDLSEIWILGATIVLRALLSLLIHFEMKTEMAEAAHAAAMSDGPLEETV